MDSWDYTWGEGIETVTAYYKRENSRARKRAVALYNATAFLIGSLDAVFSGGRIRSFREAFPGFAEDTEEQNDAMSDEAMYAQARALNAMFGGKEA